jgi:thioredoxin 1
MMKRVFVIFLAVSSMFFITCRSENTSSADSESGEGKFVSTLSNELFKELIFNYGDGKAWENTSGKPIIIDFYADWCVPCRTLTPIVEELAKEYSGKIVFYKVNIDKEKELTENMRISAVPSLMFIPSNGKPAISRGLISKEDFVKAINQLLLITKNEEL